ncbi:MAG: S8 family serine peptidase [Verrucomicrobiota bacterium]|nr:S8 family serine peptidase [Verrucomicrobiota bacterium]
MKGATRQKAALMLVVAGLSGPVCASNLDTVGVTLLGAMTTNLNGAGVRVAQAEAELSTNPPTWEVAPGAVGQPTNLFTYSSSAGTSSTYTNSLGVESSHADAVAGIFYGTLGDGAAPRVAHVDNDEADYFYNSIINPTPYLPARLHNINDAVVNQSFIFNGSTTNDQQTIDSAYDNYADLFNTLFVSGVGNGGAVNPPATCYNGIGVAAYGGSSSVGPTPDNGRAKPDLTAPAGATSFSTPLVAGAAALLIQAGLRGDGGSDTNAAADIRTVKALLLNGAVKPADWTNTAPSPLDARYGAGILNAFNSYEQLAGGEHGFTVSESVPSGGPHPPPGATGSVGASSGWDFNTISSSSGGLLNSASDGVNDYYFDVTNGPNQPGFTATVTLVWERPQSQSLATPSGINNLDLFLYDAATGNLVAASTSLVDNVQYLWAPQLPSGRYDLQVLKTATNAVSNTETYALAWEFSSTSLRLTRSGTGAVLTWPVYPDGFVVESAPSLMPPISWSTNGIPPPIFTNYQNLVVINATNASRFFRLRRP